MDAPPSTEALISRIAALIDAGRPAAARPLLAAVRRLMPDTPLLAELGARLAQREGRPDLALHELDAAVDAAPDDSRLRQYRAEIRREAGDTKGALLDAADSVLLDRKDPAAKALLGVLLLEFDRAEDARACLLEAVAVAPANPNFRQALAMAQEASGDPDAALASLRTAIEAAPRRADIRNAAILLSVRRRDFTTAVELAESARLAGVADACSFGLQGHALSSLARHGDAADAYAEALKLGPNDPYVRHLVASGGALPSASRAPIEYVRTVFDGYADQFERHLISLSYRIPGLIRSAVMQHPVFASGDKLGPVLDPGCGTGLVGLMLADLPVGPLIGVDLSPGMLEQAKAKQIYAELHETDLMSLLDETTTPWKLVLAGDVLIYFGRLEELLAAVHKCLQPGGWFICSVEELLPDFAGNIPGNGDWSLGRNGRYAHTLRYVERCIESTGFRIIRLERQTVRHEANTRVAGIFAVLERGAHDC